MAKGSYSRRDDEGWSEPAVYGSPEVPKDLLRPDGYQPYRRLAPYDPAQPPQTYPEPEYVPKYHELLPKPPPPPPPKPPLYKSLFTVVPPDLAASTPVELPPAPTGPQPAQAAPWAVPFAPMSPAPARKPQRMIGIVAAAVVVVLAVSVGSVLLMTRDPRPPRAVVASTAGRELVIPTGFDRYAMLDTDTAHQLEAQLQSSSPEASVDGSTTAVYGLGDATGPAVGLIGFSTATSPAFAERLRRVGPAAELVSFLLNAGIVLSTPHPAGALGGDLRCGTRPVAAGPGLPICAWADESMLVATFFYQTPSDSPENLTLKLRARAEH